MTHATPKNPDTRPARDSGPSGSTPTHGFEIYPMPFFALLSVSQPERVAEWYQKALGFAALRVGPAVHLRRRQYQDLLLVPATGERVPGPGGPLLYFDADGELEELAERITKAGTSGVSDASGPVATPWNTAELRVTDPAGYRLVFSSRPRNPDPGIQSRTLDLLASARRL